jgi:hypothetical protein
MITDKALARSAPTTKRRRSKPIPSLHLVMIRIAVAGVCMGGIGYFFAPIAKQAFFERLAEWSMVFLFGKFTNGFGVKSVSGDEEESDDVK